VLNFLILHEKNGFAEVSKNLARYENSFVDYQNKIVQTDC